MAENWIIEQTVELTRPVQPYVGQPVELMLPGDHLAHTLRIKCKERDMPVNLTGYTAAGYFKRTDGNTVLVVGSITGNIVDVTLSQECYAFPGNLRGVVRITNSTTDAKITLCDRLFHVGQAVDDGGTIDPGEVIPSLDDLLAEIDAMEQATAEAEAAADAVPDMVAPVFSASAPYSAGSYVYYDGTLYRFTADHAAGAWNSAQAVAVTVGGEVADLKSAVEAMGHDVDVAPKAVGSNAESVDLDVTDEDGNVLLRLADGHIKTKNFDSSVPDDITINPTNAEPSVDIDITDPNGNVVLRVESGHIKTKHFNSADFVPDETNPLGKIKENPGLTSIFLHVGCIGDSLASGAASSNEGGTTVFHDMYDYSWGQYLARATGNTYYNFSSGGLTTKTWWSSQQKTTCLDGQHNCEAYIIGLGENDAGIAEMTVGTEADIDLSDYTQNADTFYGNYGKIIQAIQELQPKAKIFVITNPIKARETAGYNTAVRDMATIFDNVYIIDLYTYGLEIFTSGDIKDCKRNGHFNAVGYKLISYVISTYIDWIVGHNLDEFNQVEFIGTEWSYNN